MRKMKDSGIKFVKRIPEDWKVLRNKQCFELEKNIVGESFENYKLLSLTKNGIIYKDINNTFGKTPESYETYQSVKNGQIIMCLFDLDISAVFSGLSNYDGMISPAYKVYNCKNNILNEYASYWFDFCFDGRKYMTYSKSLRYVVNTDDFKDIQIILPPLEEQNKIVKFLNKKIYEIDKVIEKTKETIEDYKKYKQSIITEIITKGLKKDKPKCWNKTKIKYLADLNPKCEKVIMKDDEVTYTPMEYIKNGYYIQNTGLWKNNTSSYNTYLENDIVMAKVTPCFENGNIAIMNNLIKGIGYGSSELIVFRCKNKIENKYLFYLLQSEVFKKLCVSTMTGTGGLKRVSIDFIKNYVCYIPGKVEQKNIVNYLDLKCKEIEKLVESKENLIGELENYKKSLIYEYVTGKKEVAKDVNYSAEDISNWILNKNLENRRNGKETVGITNLKLQKLLYYASGIYFLYKKCNLIKEDFVAWKHGPVIKQVYYRYNSNGAKEIQHNRKSKTDIDNETQKILEKMYSKYSKYTAEELRNMTHQERPWKKTSRNKIIEKDLIKDYFENEYKWEQ